MANPIKDSEPVSVLTSIKARLEYVYQDVTRLQEISSPGLILHPADRDLFSPPRVPLVGIAAAQAHEEGLVAATCGTMAMEVESITVGGGGVFACVMGMLRAEVQDEDEDQVQGSRGDGKDKKCAGGSRRNRRRRIEMAFCGLWRFDDAGRAVEHWENAADPAALSWLLRE
ncbi:hypothetical protein C8A03DRAFT_17462 [Achaetomium macrosporum]|uniref:SnoaL-like domain-containing protein n=1 Tax=Achaetomium macrosporum TaxID=79813 RepID=A0AAN7C5L1_9PEZI|nr:hypothetical protein C8A03DRAFT_17462 [Achaetomium macrosporum]